MSYHPQRYKVTCKLCGSQFNFDYKKTHEQKKHGGRSVSVIAVGAAENPFKAAAEAAIKCKKIRLESPDGTSEKTKTHDFGSDSQEKSRPTLPGSSIGQQQTEFERAKDLHGNGSQENKSDSKRIENEGFLTHDSSRSSIDEIEKERARTLLRTSNDNESHGNDPASTSTNTDQMFEELSWTTCAGKLKNFVDCLENSKIILKKINCETPNPMIFIAETVSFLKDISVESADLLQYAERVSNELNKEAFVLEPSSTAAFVEHDPGKRRNIISHNERQLMNIQGPYQPKNIIFPINESLPVDRQRRFNADWYTAYPHLEYSIVKDAAYCFVCSMFHKSLDESPWIAPGHGVRTWSKMKSVGANKKGKLEAHFTSNTHKNNVQSYCNFLKSAKIDVTLDKNIRDTRIKEVQEQEFNREVIKILTDVSRTLARQALAFQGHFTAGDQDRGNFAEITRLISRHNPIMSRWLEEKNFRAYRTTYMSHDSQNEFIHLIGSEIRNIIVQEIKEAGMYSIIADSTPDVSHKDMFSLIIRYVNGFGVPTERLLKIDEVIDKTGEGIAKKIIEMINCCELDTNNLCFQSYDFANNMSGIYKGTQAEISSKLGRNIPYIPCQAHRLNTFVEHATNISSIICDFFNDAEALYVFFSSSTKRFKSLETKLNEIENSLQLRNLSRTRWTARAESVKAIVASYESIVDVLDEIEQCNNLDKDTRSKASGLLKKITHFDFIVGMYFLKNIMFKLQSLTECLEGEEMNTIDALNLLRNTCDNLTQLRNNTVSMNNLIQSAESFGQKLGINPHADYESHHRIRYKPRRFDENARNAVVLSFEQFYRQHFISVLDQLSSEMRGDIDKLIETIAPIYNVYSFPLKNPTEENISKITEMAPHVFKKIDNESIMEQTVMLFNHCLKYCSTEITKLKHLLLESFKMKNALPHAYLLLKYVATATVSVASAERSFSDLKNIKGPLRSTSTNPRTDSLMMAKCNDDIAADLNLVKIVKSWSQMKHKKRRIAV